MIRISQQRLPIKFAISAFFAILGPISATAQQSDTASVIQRVDAAVKSRIDNVAGYTVTEHYAVFRGKDDVHPVAEMTVLTTYERESGKSYAIISQSGSTIIRDLILGGILKNEKNLNLPGVRESTWITSANYQMTLKPGGTQSLNGRECLVLELIPRRKAPYLIGGTLWVDSEDGSIVQVVGTMSESSSVVTGATRVMRQYANVNGFSQATQVRAVSSSFMFGDTTVTVDYRDYHVRLLALSSDDSRPRQFTNPPR